MVNFSFVSFAVFIVWCYRIVFCFSVLFSLLIQLVDYIKDIIILFSDILGLAIVVVFCEFELLKIC